MQSCDLHGSPIVSCSFGMRPTGRACAHDRCQADTFQIHQGPQSNPATQTKHQIRETIRSNNKSSCRASALPATPRAGHGGPRGCGRPRAGRHYLSGIVRHRHGGFVHHLRFVVQFYDQRHGVRRGGCAERGLPFPVGHDRDIHLRLVRAAVFVGGRRHHQWRTATSTT